MLLSGTLVRGDHPLGHLVPSPAATSPMLGSVAPRGARAFLPWDPHPL